MDGLLEHESQFDKFVLLKMFQMGAFLARSLIPKSTQPLAEFETVCSVIPIEYYVVWAVVWRCVLGFGDLERLLLWFSSLFVCVASFLSFDFYSIVFRLARASFFLRFWTWR
jgi:hypothetical protein